MNISAGEAVRFLGCLHSRFWQAAINLTEGGCHIGQVVILELEDQDKDVFEKILVLLKRHSDLKKVEVDFNPVIFLPGLEIYPNQRKIYRDRQEICLTAKEFDLLCLLVANKGRVLTYGQIYRSAWREEPLGNENNAVGYHIRNLWEASPEVPFAIRCVREVGYTFEITENQA